MPLDTCSMHNSNYRGKSLDAWINLLFNPTKKDQIAQLKKHTTPFRTISVSESLFWYTTPGQSIKKIFLVRVMYCHTFVSPGMGATLQTCRHNTIIRITWKITRKWHLENIGEERITLFDRNVLITDDFPTLGYPTNPTDIACLSFFKRANCLNTDRRDPWTCSEKLRGHYIIEQRWYTEKDPAKCKLTLPNDLLMLAWNARVG